MAKWNFEAAWAGLVVTGAALLAGVAVLAAVGVGLILFGITQGRAVR